MSSARKLPASSSTLRKTGAYVDLGISYAKIEGHADDDITFVIIDAELASSDKTVQDAYDFFYTKAKAKEFFLTPMYLARKVRVLAIKYNSESNLLRLKLQAEPLS